MVSCHMKKIKPKIEIRIANKRDAGLIALLGRITFTETFGHFFRDPQDLVNYCNSTFAVDKIENSLSKPTNVYWIALVNRLAVGYAKLKLDSKSEFTDANNVCQLQKIYVLKDFLSMKIGFELQNLLVREAKNKGFSEIWLSVLNSNKRAINFYLRNNFKQIGNHEFQIGKERFEFTAMSKQL